MSWSLNIGSVAGTAVRVHVTFLLFLAWIFGVNYFSGGAQAAWSGLLFIVLLFLCVLLHEIGHIFTARAFGVRTPDVILLPIGGVARLERIPERPSQEFLIAIAGPAVNIVIALILILLDSAHPSADRLAAVESANVSMIDRLAAVNFVSRAVQSDTGVSNGRGAGVAGAACHPSRLYPRHRNRRHDRPRRRFHSRLSRPVR
jgi:Zn-dependent protease